MISRGRRDDPAGPLLRGKGPKPVERSAQFERAGDLVALPFDEDPGARRPADRIGGRERRAADVAADPGVRRQDISGKFDVHRFDSLLPVSQSMRRRGEKQEKAGLVPAARLS
jgi:hypothetical protein